MDHEYLFVSGCPRSGTTVLTHMLNWGDSAFIGQERFAGLLNRMPEKFLPEIFSQERLARFDHGDCGYGSYAAGKEYSAWYARPKDFSSLDANKHIGDKITNLYNRIGVFREAAWTGKSITILHIVRNIFDVAASYQTRKLNAADKWEKNYEQAILDWSQSVNRVHEFLKEPQSSVRLAVVDYDAIFGEKGALLMASARKIFAYAGMPFGETQEEGMRGLVKETGRRCDLRQHHDDIRDDVEARVDTGVLARYHELLAQALY